MRAREGYCPKCQCYVVARGSCPTCGTTLEDPNIGVSQGVLARAGRASQRYQEAQEFAAGRQYPAQAIYRRYLDSAHTVYQSALRGLGRARERARKS